MKFKEIKPGMVIHCPKEEDARVLLEHLAHLGYTWGDGEPITASIRYDYEKYDCYRVLENVIFMSDIENYAYDNNCTIIECSDLIEPDDFNTPNTSSNALNENSNTQMSAVEVLEWLRRAETREFEKLFSCGDIEEMFDYHTNDEIVRIITAYEAAKKEPKPVEVSCQSLTKSERRRNEQRF